MPRRVVVLYAVLVGVLVGVLLGSGVVRAQGHRVDACAQPAQGRAVGGPDSSACPDRLRAATALLVGGAAGAAVGLAAALLAGGRRAPVVDRASRAPGAAPSR